MLVLLGEVDHVERALELVCLAPFDHPLQVNQGDILVGLQLAHFLLLLAPFHDCVVLPILHSHLSSLLPLSLH